MAAAGAEAIIFKKKPTSAKTTHSFKCAGQETTITDNPTDIEISVKAGGTTTQVLLKKSKSEDGDGDATLVVSGNAEGELVADAETEEILRVDLMLGPDKGRQDLETYKSFGLSPEERKMLEERVVALERECENNAAKSKSKDEQIRALQKRAAKIDKELASANMEKERYKKLFHSEVYQDWYHDSWESEYE